MQQARVAMNHASCSKATVSLAPMTKDTMTDWDKLHCDAFQGVSVLVRGSEDVGALIEGALPAEALQLMDAFWPGPLTLVLPAVGSLGRALTGPAGGVGLRCAADPIARALLDACAFAVTSTSANPSGQPSAVNVEAARAYFGDRIAYYLDGGAREGTAASTVVEFVDGTAHLRRVGAIAVDELARFVRLAS